MIIRPRESWFGLLFVWRGSVLYSILPQLLFMGMISSLAVLTNGRILGEKIPLNTAPFTLFGLALTIFLAFRNNASYERYTEARRLWGNLLIASRTLNSQILSAVPERGDTRRLANLIVAFAYALKHQLRETDPAADLGRLLEGELAQRVERASYRPIVVLDELRRQLTRPDYEARASDVQLWMFDAQLSEMGKSAGGCERIASTPIPFAYNVLLHRTVYMYCVLLPFGLVDSTEFFTPLLCVFVAYTLIALDAIASEIADPFGTSPNALALDSMSRTIERSVLEQCGEDLPPPIAPVRPYQFN